VDEKHGPWPGLLSPTRRSFLKAGVAFSSLAIVDRSALAAEAVARRSGVAATKAGKVRGYVDDGINVYKGIRYGADTKARRFMAALPPQPWHGVLDTIAFGPRAPQPPGMPADFFPVGDKEPVSEDCLKLNVWTPALRDGRKRPVMVWFHGGGYSGMSANTDVYDGVRLCRRGDVVVVTLNHRLNLFGHLYLAELGGPEYADSGNVGMLDLILALTWVRDNIAEFGGDPNNVMIFGESGGGAKCATLMAMPLAHGLFHKVATESGQQITVSRTHTATESARAVLQALNLTQDQIPMLRTLSMEDLIKGSRGARYYGPVKDGRSLPRDPFDPDAPPLSAGIPMILGNNHDETRLLIGAADASLFALTWEALPGKLQQHVGQFLGSLPADEVVAKYRSLYPAYTASDVFFAASTAARSWRGQVIEADRRAAQPQGSAPTWVFQLDWKTPVDGGKWGAPHGLDIPLVFDNTAYGERMTGNTEEARRVAEQMSEAYLAFAHKGDPNTSHLPRWPPFDLAHRSTMVFDTVSRVVDDPRGEERRYIGQVPYTQPGGV
jgi:para-nitrobenzyl esterase